MPWVNCRKPYDRVPHSWIIESLTLAQVAQNIVEVIKKSMTNCKADLTSCAQILGTVNIERGIFHDDSSPYIYFVYNTYD